MTASQSSRYGLELSRRVLGRDGICTPATLGQLLRDIILMFSYAVWNLQTQP